LTGHCENEVVVHARHVDNELLAEREARSLARPEKLGRRPQRQLATGGLVEPGSDGRPQFLLELAAKNEGDPQPTQLEQHGIGDAPRRIMQVLQRLEHVGVLAEDSREQVTGAQLPDCSGLGMTRTSNRLIGRAIVSKSCPKRVRLSSTPIGSSGAPFEVGPALPDLVERRSGLRLGEEEHATGDFGQP